jgi:hypothetical protein
MVDPQNMVRLHRVGNHVGSDRVDRVAHGVGMCTYRTQFSFG